MDLQSLASSIPQDTLLVILAYALLGGLYLLVVPLALFFWMNSRWTRMGKVERLLVYGLVFVCFPGLVRFAPCLKFRLSGQGDN